MPLLQRKRPLAIQTFILKHNLLGVILVTAALLSMKLSLRGYSRSVDRNRSNQTSFYTEPTTTSYSSAALRDSAVYIDGAKNQSSAYVDLRGQINPGLAYRLALHMHNLDSPDDFLRDPDLVRQTRLLQHRLRSLGDMTPADMVYYIRIFQFARDYKVDAPELFKALSQVKPAVSWRYFCYRYMDQARIWALPALASESDKEVVLIEARWFPHVEFVVRAVIKNLGQGWMFTLICSRENEALMRAIASSVSQNIRVLVLRDTHENVNDYNNMLLSAEFWERLHGEKILIVQEDSVLFRPGIEALLPYDYVGGVWPTSVVDVASRVGNGGLSLRSRSVMIEILNRCDPDTFAPSPTLRRYMEEAGLKRVPEDVFFARSMEVLGVGKIAPLDAAMHIVEGILPARPSSIIGGHQFWLAMGGSKWLEFAHEKLLTQLALPRNTIPAASSLKHRGGWKHVLKALINHDFLVPPGKRRLTGFIKAPAFEYVDVLEQLLIKNDWERWKILKPRVRSDTRLVAFMHGTVKGRFPEDILGLDYFWASPEFTAVRSRVSLLLTFSGYFASHVRQSVDQTPDMQTPVVVMKHPVSEGIVTEFDIESVMCDACPKRLVALGQQHRCTSSIYRVNTTVWQKYWMPSSLLSRAEALRIASEELDALGIEPAEHLMSTVDIVSMDSYDDYERFIASSVLLIHVRDANANNAVLDAIATSTPLIVNRHPSVVEYLGTDYPLYFDEVAEIQHILQDQPRLEQAAHYLKTMDKSQFSMKTFLTSFHGRVEEVIRRFG